MFEGNQQFREFETADQLSDLLPEITVAAEPVARAQPEARGFELPRRIWFGMIACYAIFLAAMIAALGSSGKTMLSLAVSIVYVAMFFGVARVVMRQNPDAPVSPLDRDGFLMTHFGPMEKKSVYAQVLVVPACVALFGVAVGAIIIATGAAS